MKQKKNIPPTHAFKGGGGCGGAGERKRKKNIAVKYNYGNMKNILY